VCHCFRWPFGSMRRRCFGPHRSVLVRDGPCGSHLRGSRRTRGWRRGSQRSHDVSSTLQRQRRPPRGCGCLALSRHPRLLMPWFTVCSACPAPRLPKSLYAVLKNQVREVLVGGKESPRQPLHSLCGNGIWYSRGGHATAFLTELSKQATAPRGMHVGNLLAS
jgi:hypothetical protein